MRITWIFLAVLLIGCVPHTQRLESFYDSEFGLVTAVSEGSGLSPLDKKLLAKVDTKCPFKEDTLDPSQLDDSTRNVQARWKYLNCLYQEPPQGKRRALVVFLDGTGNSDKDQTNIWRLYNRTIARAVEGEPIIPYYDRGVGTNFQRLTGSAFGAGVNVNVRQAYRFLVETYKPKTSIYEGDRIYLFGFSRGAFTARTLNGLIEFAGLAHLDSTPPDMLDESRWLSAFGNLHRETYGLFDVYTQTNSGEANFDKTLRRKLDEYKEKHGIKTYRKKVEAIGVFDTVPAIGLFRRDDPDKHRLELYAERGYHAMSIDEQRDDFRLLRFGVPQWEGQRLEEMWFAGVHSDIGGGYGKDTTSIECAGPKPIGLEGIPLRWMMNNFRQDEIFTDKDLPDDCYAAALHDEYFGKLRRIYLASGIAKRRPVACDSINAAVIERIQLAERLPLPNPHREETHYQPTNLGHSPSKTFCVLKTGQQRQDCLQLDNDCGTAPKTN